MGCSSGPDIIQDGLTFCLDAASIRSYPKTGTSWTDLKNSKVGSFVNMTSSNFSEDNGGCINFGGTNGYIQTNLNFSPGTHYEEFTCAVWCKHGTSAHSGYNALMVSNYGGTPIPFNMYAGGNGTFADKFVLYTRVGGGSMQLNSVSDINDDEWHYCVGTRAGIGASSRDYSVYVDGELENTTTSSVVNQGVTNNIVIGALNVYLNQAYYNGKLACVSIYDRALTADEVRQNYLSTKERFA